MEDLPEVKLTREERVYDPSRVDRTYVIKGLDEEHARLFQAMSETIDSVGGSLEGFHLFTSPFNRCTETGQKKLSFQFMVRSYD